MHSDNTDVWVPEVVIASRNLFCAVMLFFIYDGSAPLALDMYPLSETTVVKHLIF